MATPQTPKQRKRRPAPPPITYTMPAELAAKAEALEILIAQRKRDNLFTDPWEEALGAIRETVKRQAVAWAEQRAKLPQAAADDRLDAKHNLPPLEFRARFLAFARRQEQPHCQRCLGEWVGRETPARIQNAEGDELLVHADCLVEDDVIL